jgi:hypothetical protein
VIKVQDNSKINEVTSVRSNNINKQINSINSYVNSPIPTLTNNNINISINNFANNFEKSKELKI